MQKSVVGKASKEQDHSKQQMNVDDRTEGFKTDLQMQVKKETDLNLGGEFLKFYFAG